MSEDHNAGMYRCRDCEAEVPVNEAAGRSMMNRENPCPSGPGGSHDWEAGDAE